MGRPKKPLIDRDTAIAKALELIDANGLESFSIRKLGSELGVNGASLYHHFKDKDDILDGVKFLVLRQTRALLPRSQKATWQDFVVRSITRYRAALLRHPNTAPLMVPGGSGRPIGLVFRESLVERMGDAGVPAQFQYAIIDSVECLAFGSALNNSRQLPPIQRFGSEQVESLSHLHAALQAAPRTTDRLFKMQLTALLDGWTSVISRQAADTE